MDDRFRAVANEEEDLYEIAEGLAYDNFEGYGGPNIWTKS